MTIKFSSNINLVTQETLLKRFPHLREIVKIEVSSRYQLSNAVTVRKRGPSHLWQRKRVKNREEFSRRQQQFAALKQINPTDILRYTDPASVCTIAGVASKNRCDIFHLIPAVPLLSIPAPNLEPMEAALRKRLKSTTADIEGTLIGGVSCDLESNNLYAALNSLFKRLGIPTRRLWGSKPQYQGGISLYYSRDGHYWCVPEKKTFSALAGQSKHDRLKWLTDNYERINLLPHDKLFIHNLSEPVICSSKKQ